MNHRGFTLIELMIAVAIIGILAAVGIPSYIGYINNAAHSEAQTLLPDLISKEIVHKKTWNRYVTVNKGYPRTVNTSSCGSRSPQLGDGTSDNKTWMQLGYSEDNDKGTGIFGTPTYFKYAFDATPFEINPDTENNLKACAKRCKLGPGGKNEFASISIGNQRVVDFLEFSGNAVPVRDCAAP